MGSLKRWRRVGQGQVHKWEQSAWRVAHDRRYGPLGMPKTADGLITFLLSAALLSSSGRRALDAGPDCAAAQGSGSGVNCLIAPDLASHCLRCLDTFKRKRFTDVAEQGYPTAVRDRTSRDRSS